MSSEPLLTFKQCYENNECLAQNISSDGQTDGLNGTVIVQITNDHQSLLPKCVSFLLGDFSIENCNGLVSIWLLLALMFLMMMYYTASAQKPTNSMERFN